jgi:hypothetical protein
MLKPLGNFFDKLKKQRCRFMVLKASVIVLACLGPDLLGRCINLLRYSEHVPPRACINVVLCDSFAPSSSQQWTHTRNATSLTIYSPSRYQRPAQLRLHGPASPPGPHFCDGDAVQPGRSRRGGAAHPAGPQDGGVPPGAAHVQDAPGSRRSGLQRRDPDDHCHAERPEHLLPAARKAGTGMSGYV